MAEDSKLWREAYESYKREKALFKPYRPSTKSITPYYEKSNDSIDKIQNELYEINNEIKRLKKRKIVLRQQLNKRASKKKVYRPTPWLLYALRLENNYWYVGMSHNVRKRFNNHVLGKGARWTALHKPIEIVEVRPTQFILESDASRLEDDMTIEYAMKYGSAFVRGGGYCQAKPSWPDIIIQNELKK